MKNIIISIDVKGYGIDYGVCYPTDNNIEIPCTLDKLGITIYNILTKDAIYWEKFTLKVIY